jgi:hypothetical protein
MKKKIDEQGRFVLEVIDSGHGKFFFSQPILLRQHDSYIQDKNLAGLIRTFLRENPEAEILIKNSVANKIFIQMFGS